MTPPRSELDDWKKFLLTLPDAGFFSLARHYLGELTTPFTKHQILQDLLSRLARPQWKEARRILLNSDDLEILTAILVLQNPLAEETAAFLGTDPVVLRPKLLNLQERLLVYPKTTSRGPELMLSPLVTEDVEIKALLRPSRLYASFEAAPVEGTPSLHEGTLLALLSFLLETPLEKSSTGLWKKKPRQDYLERFSALGSTLPDLLLRSAENLGLILWKDGHTRVVFSYWSDFALQPRASRLALLWTSAGPWDQGPLFEIARRLWIFLDLFRADRAYPMATLVRLSERLGDFGTSGQRQKLFEAWTHWGLLVPGPQAGTWQFPAQVFAENPSRAPSAIPVQAYLQANFELRVPHDAPFDLAWPAALAARLVRWDRLIQWELGKTPVHRALSRGMKASDLEKGLETLTGRPLAQNIGFSLQEWEREHQALRLWKGTILVVDENRRYLVEHTSHFQTAVLSVLSEGVYLVREDLLKDWSKELEQKGLPALPPVSEEDPESRLGSPWSFGEWAPETGDNDAFTEAEPLAAQEGEDSGEALMMNLRRKLHALDIPADEKEEWSWRLGRRLVMDEEQMLHPVGKGERLEAKGLDYAGKIRLAEQALSSQADLLEIVTRDPEGHPVQVLIRPSRIEKQGGEIYLYGEGIDPLGPFKAIISRLSLVKKIRGSLFS